MCVYGGGGRPVKRGFYAKMEEGGGICVIIRAQTQKRKAFYILFSTFPLYIIERQTLFFVL